MAQKVDEFRGVDFVFVYFPVVYISSILKKEWTKYRGVFFTFIAIL
jgi:hypothetical protein